MQLSLIEECPISLVDNVLHQDIHKKMKKPISAKNNRHQSDRKPEMTINL
jgi:hypothetical protein